jgi:hypothetical protein
MKGFGRKRRRMMEKNSEMKLKPFDLEKALKGEKVVTRDGREASQFFLMKGNEYGHNLVFQLDGQARAFPEWGKVGTVDDLFMAPKERVVRVNLYRNGTYGPKHETQKYADLAAHGYERLGNRAYPITIEED